MYDTEEEYFIALTEILLSIGIDENRIESTVHRIMDVWTFDGILDKDSLDSIIIGWI